jgi:hypothetical protein
MSRYRQSKTARESGATAGIQDRQAKPGASTTGPETSSAHSIREKQVNSNITPTRTARVEAIDGLSASAHLEKIIRRRAYELYEERGRGDGHAEQDWLLAEAEVIGTITRRAKLG